MAEEQKKARMLRLSQAPKLNKNLKGPYIIIGGTGYTGVTTVQGAEVFGKVSKLKGDQEKPTHAYLADSKSNPGDVVAVPEMTGSADHIDLEWIDQGKIIRMDLSRFMALKAIVIPEGMKLYIPVYVDTDSELDGAVVGWNLREMEFVPTTRAKKKEVAATQQQGGMS
ncbi:MAG TPA: hypothetical protein VK464_11095 [Symbiobacteriaceae bacterium]|jgi:hypothetical protein|nr:hypothetical protein [Symbiobacteriaceae bacterium]